MYTFQAPPRFGKTSMGRALGFATTMDSIKACALLGGSLDNMVSHNSVKLLFKSISDDQSKQHLVDSVDYHIVKADGSVSDALKHIGDVKPTGSRKKSDTDVNLSESTEDSSTKQMESNSSVYIANSNGSYITFSDYSSIFDFRFFSFKKTKSESGIDLVIGEDRVSEIEDLFNLMNPFITYDKVNGYMLFFNSKALLMSETYFFDGFPYLMIGESSVTPPAGVISRHSQHNGYIPLIASGKSVLHPYDTSYCFYKLNRCFGDSISSQLFSAAGPALSGGASSGFLSQLQVSNINECIGYYAPVFQDQTKDPFLQLDLSGYTAGDLVFVSKLPQLPNRFEPETMSLYGTSRRLKVGQQGFEYYDREILVPFYADNMIFGNSIVKILTKNEYSLKGYDELFGTKDVYDENLIRSTSLGVARYNQGTVNGLIIHPLTSDGKRSGRKIYPSYEPINVGRL